MRVRHVSAKEQQPNSNSIGVCLEDRREIHFWQFRPSLSWYPSPNPYSLKRLSIFVAFSPVMEVKDEANLLQLLSCFFSSKHSSPHPSREEGKRWSRDLQKKSRGTKAENIPVLQRGMQCQSAQSARGLSGYLQTEECTSGSNWAVALSKVSTLIRAVNTSVIASAISHPEIPGVPVSCPAAAPVLELVLPKPLQMFPKWAP